MIDDDPPLSERQQQMMAYVDDEMSAQERREFEDRMALEPDLAREVVNLENLLDLSHSLALSEPTDHEIRRFWSRFYNRTEWQLGWLFMVAGLALLAGEGLYLVLAAEDFSWVLKTGLISTLIGGTLLAWNALRLKLRTSHYDRYRGVMR